MALGLKHCYPKAGFQSLPRELRDQVYHELLLISSAPPESPEDAGPRYEEWLLYPMMHWSFFYPIDLYPPSACGGLMASNPQIEHEVRVAAGSPDFHLDIMIEHFKIGRTGQRAWPTWIVYPGLFENIRELRVDVRVCKRDQIHGDMYSLGAWGFVHGPVFWLLNRFFHHGPQFIYKGPFFPKIHVDTLRIVLSPMTHEHPSFKHLFKEMSEMASLGVFYGQILNIQICAGDHVRQVRPEFLAERETPPDKSIKYGMHWGFLPSRDNPTDVI